MSKAASTRSSPSPGGALPPAGAGRLVESLAPLLHEWLPRQRWFAGKGRPITGFSAVAATELLPPGAPGAPGADPGLLHLLVRVEQRSTPDLDAPPVPVAPTDDCYQLLLGVRSALPPGLAAARVGVVGTGPLAGRTVYEALHDPHLTDLLLEHLRSPGALGPLRFDRAVEIPAGLVPRLLGAEQSNSSLVYGEEYILKILRRVFPGANPDLELPLALARQGCRRVPSPVAWFEAVGADMGGGAGREPLTLGVLQPFLQDSEDGWQLALRALADGRGFTDEARALGRATAEVHLALAAALPTVSLGPRQTAQLAGAMSGRLDATAQAVPALLPYVAGLRTAFDALARSGSGRDLDTRAQRVHGDLHLGQTLRTPDGEWSLIDFEGEPARPLTERRRPQPAVRDVAGMLRSFDYAARSHLPWNPDWAERSRSAYCDGYAEATGTDPREDAALLRAYETDKAVYEVLYEARNRPDWLPVPMAAIHRLAGHRP
ncbi:maltokinase N-terminal cap-like domain-containing protein [Streptomyces sp. NBC_01506]|uniref:maltokinase N-terminal cap-like domain-containing protein n=1 Tax=Streptomyces sp. NBC_01506 TaxID=2903887 RepID=UPI00386628C1